ncbi:MAG: C39 family peptidase, partial [Actinomycetota bacterium]|nr:C39 family peptidase [Actinomycetota bacterium]
VEPTGFEVYGDGSGYEAVALLSVDTAAVSGPYLNEQGQSSWCCPVAPETWTQWESPVDPALDSWNEGDWSSDWGQVDAEWAAEGEELYSVTEQEPFSSLLGSGHAADIFWEDQGQTNYSGPYAIRATLSELYGYDVDVNEIIERSAQNGWLVFDDAGEVKGVYAEHIDDMFASYGVPSRDLYGEAGAWENLNNALTNNQRIVLNLDGKELDAGTSVGDVPGGLDSDHFVAVTGVDYARGVVIVNDSARGAGLEIPLQTFYESWRDSDFRMTVTDIAAAPTAQAAAFNTEAPDYATLGMTMQPSLAESYGLGLEEVAGASLETVPAEETPVPWCTAPIEIVTPDVAATEAAISGSPGMPVAYERYSGCVTPVPSIVPDTNEGTFAPTAGPVAMESAPAPAPATVAFEPLPAPPAADPLAGTVIAGTNGTLPLNLAAPSAGSGMTIGDTGLYPSTMTTGGPSDPASAIIGATTVGGTWGYPLGVSQGDSGLYPSSMTIGGPIPLTPYNVFLSAGGFGGLGSLTPDDPDDDWRNSTTLDTDRDRIPNYADQNVTIYDPKRT